MEATRVLLLRRAVFDERRVLDHKNTRQRRTRSPRESRAKTTRMDGRSTMGKPSEEVAGEMRGTSRADRSNTTERAMNSALTSLELFSGAGGLALGLEAAGFDHLAL